ncbi:glycosyltransferase family 2 protein [Photobacterium sp. DNB23_23_1]|uniref:Glycosyltransferase family 2 protein n=1 Tax=Photobacterium pectinilyticum TaxID=2906793 RepID=A0ABT1N741_9GAMM|nr:glycosyltransferase family A protein [Photobacterium sp. ZSDE20]MCQ1059907.1 glycosyltransferase family 2 protein [Photobacterium sp. ZSDE20]MDD1826500.1 glycosyltransferase family 2 protein [Photobacterium sp. ZSDE20]
MNSGIEVSVVIPNYNCLPTLPRAIESIRMQDIPVEIIVVDDGSSDGSREWLAQQADIKLLMTERSGASQARNHGIEHCSNELIAFLDADDYWLENKLSQQLSLHQHNPELIFSFTDYMHMTEEGQPIIGCFDYWPRFHKQLSSGPVSVFPVFTPLLFAENVVGTSTVMVNKQALVEVGGFDAELKSASDWDLWLKMAEKGAVGVLSINLCHYISDRADAISRDHNKRLKAMKLILNKHRSTVSKHPTALLAGYLRWVTGKAEYNRLKKAYLISACQELAVLCLQPSKQRMKAAGRDILNILS